MIELYTYQTPNGQKASVMLEEVGLAYVVRSVDLMKGAQREPEFLRISPNNKIPAIVDDGGPEGRTTIFESGAILVYLADKTGRVLPPSGRARSDAFQWLFWAMSGVGPGIGRFASVALFSKDPDGALVKSLAEEVVRLLTVLDKRLAGSQFLADDYSIADIGAFTWVDYIRKPITKFVELPQVPAVDHWLADVGGREAVKRGLRVPMAAVRPPASRV